MDTRILAYAPTEMQVVPPKGEPGKGELVLESDDILSQENWPLRIVDDALPGSRSPGQSCQSEISRSW